MSQESVGISFTDDEANASAVPPEVGGAKSGPLEVVRDKSRINYDSGTATIVVRSKGKSRDEMDLLRSETASNLALRYAGRAGLSGAVFNDIPRNPYPCDRLGNIVTSPQQVADHYRVEFDLIRPSVF